MIQNRLNRLTALMASAGLDAIALNPGPSLTYLTGLHFHLMERPTVLLFAPPKSPVIILPGLESAKLNSASIPLEAIPFTDNPANWQHAFVKAVDCLHLEKSTIGVEPTRFRYLELHYLENAAPEAQFTSAEAALTPLRLCKDKDEISAMQNAARIAEEALQKTLPLVKPGLSERQLASELVLNLLRSGSDSELPFAPIVASGPNSANPHAAPSDRVLTPGDLVLFDWGATCAGYRSDITRTFALGEPEQELRAVYEVVKQANMAGRQAGRPRIPAGDIDKAARQVIEQAGYGQYFTHRTGHGLGMEGHEAPYMFAENDLILEDGMVYTVEPGIYLPGLGGVRIEDDVVVTPDGSLSLTSLPRDLVIL